MSEQFDDYSKHLATKHSRRGALKFLGAGFIGVAVSTLFSNRADASTASGENSLSQATPHINNSKPPYYWPPRFNGISPYRPEINDTQPPWPPRFNGTRPYKPEINDTLPPYKPPHINEHDYENGEAHDFLRKLLQLLRNSQ